MAVNPRPASSVLRGGRETATHRDGIRLSRATNRMSANQQNPAKLRQWRLECLAHSLIEGLAGLLPGPWLFRLGEGIGGLVWHFMPSRRNIILRNLRIAFGDEIPPAELRRMAKETFRRTAGNLISAAHTARLTPDQLGRVLHLENLDLLEQALARGKGVVLLLAHMGNWEVLSRLIHLFPKGSKTGAFYRPLNNLLLDERVLKRRQADGTRMFSKRDPFHQVTSFLREGGIVGILADQRVGMQGEIVPFFGRVTRASPLPSLLARRAKSEVLALSVVAVSPGKWKAVFTPVATPYSTANCMVALENAMKASPTDVFWLQERWKVYVRHRQPMEAWLGPDTVGEKPHRVLLWLAGVRPKWQLAAPWIHPDVEMEVALAPGQDPPDWLPGGWRVHHVPESDDPALLRETIAAIDELEVYPLDFILTTRAPKPLLKAARREAIPVISVP